MEAQNEFQSLVMNDIKEENGDWFSLTVYYNGSTLCFFDHDFSKFHEELFGDEEYEGYRIFDEENTSKLKSIFNTEDLLKAIYDYINNAKNKDIDFYKLCAEKGIKYKYHVR